MPGKINVLRPLKRIIELFPDFLRAAYGSMSSRKRRVAMILFGIIFLFLNKKHILRPSIRTLINHAVLLKVTTTDFMERIYINK